MQLSRYFYHIFLAYVWLSVEVPHLCRSAVVASDKKQDSEQYWTALNQCLQKCSGDIKARISMINNTEGQQPCYDECLRKIGSPHFTRNQQVESWSKRIKRDSNGGKTFEPGKKCNQSLRSMAGLKRKYIKITFLPSSYDPKSYLANVSWTRPEITSNWTGYTVVYDIYSEDETSPLFCKDVVGKNITSTVVNVTKEGLKIKSIIYVGVIYLPHSQANGSKAQMAWVKVPSPGTPTTTRSPNKTTVNSPSGTPTTTRSPNKTTINSPSAKRPGEPTTIIVAVACSCLLLLVSVVCLWRLKQRKKETIFAPLDPDFKFDAFIIYSTVDENWVTKKLLPTLESKHNIKCCIHYRDFVPGVPFTKNMADSVYNSKKTVAVVSKSFLTSNYCSHELSIALHRLAERGDDSVVVFKLDDIKNSQLPQELRFRSYIDFTKSTDKRTWEYKLVNCLKSGTSSSLPLLSL
ncbi:uncharacterized protein [Montipora foliosa]|uniref:uncharacterized protein isoform X1 n=1 Tax=Montipora foliosa TaxID=591990 RepID=UPI0035F11106